MITQKLYFLVFLLFGIYQGVNAQVNIKAGYEMIFINPKGTNAIIDAYNTKNSWVTNNFDDLDYLHGLTLGLRYQAKPFAWEVSYSKRFNVRRSAGNNPDFSGLEVTQRLSYDVELVSFAQEFQFGDFGVGASIDYHWLDVKTEVIDQEDTQTVVKDQAWGSQFYFVYHTPKSGFISLSIQPYVQLYWSEFDVVNLSREFRTNSVNRTTDDLFHFGLKLIFYNGE